MVIEMYYLNSDTQMCVCAYVYALYNLYNTIV